MWSSVAVSRLPCSSVRVSTEAPVLETGSVTFIQRFGSALNLNIHLHMLVLDGAYTFTHDRARFQPMRRHPRDAELVRLLNTLI